MMFFTPKSTLITMIITHVLLVLFLANSVVGRTVEKPSNRRAGKYSVVDWSSYNSKENEGPGTYAFGYDIEDAETNNVQFRNEQRHSNGTVTGSYGYLEPDGNIHIVNYIADARGYRATIENNPSPKQGQTTTSTRKPSPALQAAIASREVYKQQTVHEQRIRPVDKYNQPTQFGSNKKPYSVRKPVINNHLEDIFDR